MFEIEFTRPEDIERRSFEIITGLLGNRTFPPLHEPVVKRVIHATADLDYAETLTFSSSAVSNGINALRAGGTIVTDTKMAAAGINQKTLALWGGRTRCFIDDPDLALQARELNCTRASLCMEKAAGDPANRIFAIGNAPTALIKLCELIENGTAKPALVVGVPVGFVNVLESKTILKQTDVPYILTEGKRGGSTVAAAIINALLYLAVGRSN